MKRIALFALLVISVMSSCRMLSKRTVRGDGNVVTQNRNVGMFDAIEASSAVNVYVTQGAAREVRVIIDQNLQQLVETYVENGTLHVRQENNSSIESTGDIKVYVTAPTIKKIGASGASNVYGQNRFETRGEFDIDLSGASFVKLDVKSPDVDVQLSGACNAELTGETKEFHIEGSGASGVKAFGLLAETVDVEMSGAGNAEVYASVKLDARTSGASSVEYKCAASVNSDVSGAGSVKKRD